MRLNLWVALFVLTYGKFKGMTNKENTLEFKKDGDYYRVFMLPDHPFYEFRPDGARGGLILSPSNIDYDCWVSENLVVDGEIRDGSVVIANCKVQDVTPNSLNFIGPGAVIEKSDIRGSYIRIVGSKVEKVKVIGYGVGHRGNTIEITDSKITGGLDIYESPITFDKLHILKSELHGEIILNVNNNEDNTHIIDSVLVGNMEIDAEVTKIEGCFVTADDYTFTLPVNMNEIIV